MRAFGFIAALLCMPVTIHAQVLFTEIMYAPEGADATHEWVEICNTGDTHDVSTWKFFENDTNHGLTLSAGTAVLAVGDCAVIADNAAVFAGDYPSFAGNLFDSAFSLKNTGETLVLKDGDGISVDSITYSDTDGAKDDGNSLHRDGTTFTAGTPTPGTESGVDATENTANDTTDSGNTQVTHTNLYSYESVTIEPPQDVHIRVPDEITTTVGATTMFTLESYDATGQAVEDGSVQWAFGDGAHAPGRTVAHRFLYEGTYTTSVVLTRGSLFDTQYITVNVVPLHAVLSIGERGAWVALENTSTYPLDISNWRIMSAGQYFKLPEQTVVAAGAEVRFPREVTGLTLVRTMSTVTLVYPDGTLALTTDTIVDTSETIAPQEGKHIVTENNASVVQAEISLPASSVIGTPVPEEGVVSPVVSRPARTQAPQVPKDVASESTAAMVSLPVQESNNSAWWYIGFLVFMLIGVVAAVLVRPRALVVDGFEVIEVKE